MKNRSIFCLFIILCQLTVFQLVAQSNSTISPVYVTDAVKNDSDDPAIWINKKDPINSLILGTDKDIDGAIYVYNLEGKIQENKVVRNLKRPNNIDIEYGLRLNGLATDIAVTTERFTHKLRVFSLPNMTPIDQGGIDMFENEIGNGFRDLMGISLYKAKNKSIYAIVGRKNGPLDGYLWQYLLHDDGAGHVKATFVRKFGTYSGRKEIESIAVDDELGYIYYSDEGVGVRKYYADPLKGNKELALFAQSGFSDDHEGISIYQLSKTQGYILVSDQSGNNFQIFSREGTSRNPHEHVMLKKAYVQTSNSDGSETCAYPFNKTFPKGIFVAMSDNKTFQIYRWEDIAGKELKSIK
jgi:3-phytase